MGYAPHIEDVEAEAGRAVEACPDDPTPLWLLGQVQSAQASLIESFFTYERGPRAMARAAEASFAGLRAAYPGLAAGLGRRRRPAPPARRRGRAARPAAVPGACVAAGRPGGVRRGAAPLDDPALLLGWGRALSANGRDEEAVDALEEADELSRGEPVHQTVLVAALERADRPDEVVETIEETPRLDRPMMASLSLSPRRIGVGEPASANYGFDGSRAGAAYDQSRSTTPGRACRTSASCRSATAPGSSRGAARAPTSTALIEDGRADDAWQLVSDGVDPESWDGNSVDCHGGPLPPPDDFSTQPGFTDSLTALGRIGLVAALETGDPDVRADALSRADDGYTSPDALLSQAFGRAERLLASRRRPGPGRRGRGTWQQELPDDPWAHHRAGELAFLAGDHGEAADDYERALDAVPDRGGVRRDGVRRPRAGAAVRRRQRGPGQHRAGAGRRPGARRRLRRRGLVLPVPARRAARARAVRLRARADLLRPLPARLARAVRGRPRGGGRRADRGARPGVRRGGAARPERRGRWGRQASRLSSGAQDNNLALALARLDRGDDAVTYAGAALAHDPANPVYVDTVAFAQHLAGHGREAADAYRAALAADPTSYVSANNLAVLLAQDGDRTDAAAVLEDALRAAPDYAIGWHNLGVVQAPGLAGLAAGVPGRAGERGRPRP